MLSTCSSAECVGSAKLTRACVLSSCRQVDAVSPSRCHSPTTDCEQICYKGNWTVVVQEGGGKIYPDDYAIRVADENWCYCPILPGQLQNRSLVGQLERRGGPLYLKLEPVGDTQAMLTVSHWIFCLWNRDGRDETLTKRGVGCVVQIDNEFLVSEGTEKETCTFIYK
eukprot:1541642-Rhodomonas_salina.1